jgi:predicted Ser/Thr protein kinase
MNLEDLVEARLAGAEPAVPAELRDEFAKALAGYEALQYALGETIAWEKPLPADAPPPVLPDDYQIVRELGRGGMGVVYLVRQQSLDRLVAVKVLRPGEVTFGRLVKRFLGEAKHLARLRHPNIVSIHEVGHAGDEPYFTMDYVDGEPLSAILARERLLPTRALAIWKQAADGVSHAHVQGIIHRDLKPGNILLGAEGRAFVTDFGLARDMTQTSKLTHSGEVMGTPAYMAPEQALGQGDRIGEATDVHALGAILYEMLTGRPPYGSDAPANVLVRLLHEEPVAPRRIDRRIPRDLETICMKALVKQPEGRYATVQAFLEDVRRFEAGEPVQARRPGLLYRASRFVGRHWKIGGAVTLTAAVLLALAPFFLNQTVEQLVAVGDEQVAAGETVGAIRVYRRALAKAGGGQRRAILDKILRCCETADDEKNALDACLLVMESEPDLSFGKYDYLVAQALVARFRANDPGHSIIWSDNADQPLLHLAHKRLAIFLSGGGGTEAQRHEAEETLDVITRKLANQPMGTSRRWIEPTELPPGSAEELLRMAGDAKIPHWDRGKAAYAAGLKLEQLDLPAARAAFRQAYDLMRVIYPMYGGVARGMQVGPVDTVDEAPECELLREVVAAMRRSDAAVPDPLRGELRIHVDGPRIPEGMHIWVRVYLWDPGIKDTTTPASRPPEMHNYNLGRYAPIRGDQTIRVGVADGRYRVLIEKSGFSPADGELGRLGQLFELEGDSLPDVEIHGTTKEPKVRARLVEEVNGLSPAADAKINLQTDRFQWTAVAGAAYYQVTFGYLRETPAGSASEVFAHVRSNTSSLCLSDPLPATALLREKLFAGRTGIWTVTAYDAQGHRVGDVVGNYRPFFVARGP